MTKRRMSNQRISSLFLLLLMIISNFTAVCLTANAEATISKTEKSYDIAVVFDNSGSMYQGEGWCRAKYAMEIFASMLNYDKDKLHIFPMWEVTTDGSQPDSGGSYSAIEIKSKNDIDKISRLYTVHPSNTPFAPITEAHNYLKKSTANEKWLIVLTDGEFNQEARGKGASINLQKRLSSLASNTIKIQYLGFGEATALKADESNNFFTKKSSDTSLKDDLIGICNEIFQRSVLPGDRLNGSSLNIDLSMKNVIVFAQGANAKIISLKDSNGKEIPITLNSGQRKYSNIKAKGYSNAPVDSSLAGQVVTFASCSKGEYTLSYSGADAIQIFYEPDVDIEVVMTNSDGETIDGSSDDIPAGEYTVTSKIVDRATRDDVTSHELMGSNVNLKTYVKTSKDSEYKEYSNGSKITLEPDSGTEITIEGVYLDKYRITSKDDPGLAWLSELKIGESETKLKLKADVEQTWYRKQDHDTWQPIKVSITLDGQELTDEQLKHVNLLISTSNDLMYRWEPIAGQSAYNIYIAQDENGKYAEPNTGKYKLNMSAIYTDEYGSTKESNKETVSFEIRTYSKVWRWIFISSIILILLAILAAVTWLLHHIKVFPKGVYVENAVCKVGRRRVGVVSVDFSEDSGNRLLKKKKTGTIVVRSSIHNMVVSLSVEASHPLFRWPFIFQKSNRRNYKIVGISANGFGHVSVNSTVYNRENYPEVDETGGDGTTVEFGKRVNNEIRFVTAELKNK